MVDPDKILFDVESEISDTFSEFIRLEKKIRKGTATSAEIKEIKKLGKFLGMSSKHMKKVVNETPVYGKLVKKAKDKLI